MTQFKGDCYFDCWSLLLLKCLGFHILEFLENVKNFLMKIVKEDKKCTGKYTSHILVYLFFLCISRIKFYIFY